MVWGGGGWGACLCSCAPGRKLLTKLNTVFLQESQNHFKQIKEDTRKRWVCVCPSFNPVNTCHMTSHDSIDYIKTAPVDDGAKVSSELIRTEIWPSGVRFDAFMSLLSSPFQTAWCNVSAFKQVQTGLRPRKQTGLLKKWKIELITPPHTCTSEPSGTHLEKIRTVD